MEKLRYKFRHYFLPIFIATIVAFPLAFVLGSSQLSASGARIAKATEIQAYHMNTAPLNIKRNLADYLYGSGKKDESLSRILLETENLYTVISYPYTSVSPQGIAILNDEQLHTVMNFLSALKSLTYRAYFATAENDGVTEASCRQALDKVYTTVLSPVSELGQNQTLQLAQSLMSEEGSALLDTLSKMQTPS